MARYQLIVGNIGTVLDTDNGFTANAEFMRCRRESLAGIGRVSGESVTLMLDCEPAREHVGTIDAGESE